MPPGHPITYLDAEVRERIDRFLSEKRRTVDEFHKFLLDEVGLAISRTSSHRYQQSFETVAAKMRESRQMSAALAEEIGEENLQGKQGRTLIGLFQALVQDGLLQRLETAGEGRSSGIDAKDAMMLARAIKDLLSASKIDVDREVKIREEAAKDAAEKALAICQKMAKEQGVTLDQKAALAEIRSELGIER